MVITSHSFGFSYVTGKALETLPSLLLAMALMVAPFVAASATAHCVTALLKGPLWFFMHFEDVWLWFLVMIVEWILWVMWVMCSLVLLMGWLILIEFNWYMAFWYMWCRLCWSFMLCSFNILPSWGDKSKYFHVFWVALSGWNHAGYFDP